MKIKTVSKKKIIGDLFSFNVIFIYIILLYGSLVSSIVIPLLIDLEYAYNSFILDNWTNYFGMGSIEAVFITISTFSLFFWGFFVDRFKRKFFAISGILITILGALIIIIFPKFVEIYLIGRFLMGIGLGVITPVSYSLAGDIINYENRSTVSGGLSIAVIAGSGIAILSGSILGSINLFLPFILIILLSIILIILILLIKEPVRGQEEPELRKLVKIQDSNIINENFSVYSQTVSPRIMLLLLKRKTNLFMFLQGIFALIPSVILTYYLISFLHDNRYGGVGLELYIATFFSLGIASGRLIGYLVWGVIGDWLQVKDKPQGGRVFVAAFTMLAQGPLMIFAFCISSLIPFLGTTDISFPGFILDYPLFIAFGILFFIAAFVGGGSGPNRRSVTYDVNEPEFRGQASSLFSIGDQIGASIGLLLANSLIIYYGYDKTFIILSFGYIIAGLCWLLCLNVIKTDENK
ncbi:MAG: MFS transporter, partial [Candidatus Hodarchaeales archaeon]